MFAYRTVPARVTVTSEANMLWREAKCGEAHRWIFHDCLSAALHRSAHMQLAIHTYTNAHSEVKLTAGSSRPTGGGNTQGTAY